MRRNFRVEAHKKQTKEQAILHEISGTFFCNFGNSFFTVTGLLESLHCRRSKVDDSPLLVVLLQVVTGPSRW